MWVNLIGLVAVMAISGTTSALARCNPGSVHCVPITQELVEAKKIVNQNCDPGPAEICGDFVEPPASASKTRSQSINHANTITKSPPIK